jgi:macrolide transport system ATP-binding/permease protein
MEERFHALPGVKRVGISTYTPMEDNNWSNGVQVRGQPDLNVEASFVKANAEYFDSVGTHRVMGRGIGVRDTSTARPMAVVNQAFVNKHFKDGNPLGQHFGASGPDSTGDFEIVGVVEDTAYTSARWKDHRMFFVPVMQRPATAKDPIEQG